MIFGWALLSLAVVLTASLTFSFTRQLLEEHRRRPTPAPSEPLTRRLRRVGRVVIEPILGR